MKLIKTKPRYKCDYCQYTATEKRMKRHEQVCWKNPDRFCPECKNTGEVLSDTGLPECMEHMEPCYFCSKYKPEEYTFGNESK